MKNIVYSLQRLSFFDDYSIGVLYKNSKILCFTLEDEKRTIKINGETRIPFGTYEIKLRTFGSMSERYSKKFHFHKGMLHLQNVPNFSFVYIHIGNTDDDTAGCILVGNELNIKKNMLIGSTLSYTELYQDMLSELNQGNKIFINVIDELIY